MKLCRLIVPTLLPLVLAFCAAVVLDALAPAGLARIVGTADAGAVIQVRAPIVAQEQGEEGDENEVPPEQVDKYVAIYRAMQRDHSLTVEQAAERQGLTLSAFRDIEHKIERDDMMRERVREALRNKPTESGATGASPEASPAGQPQK